MPWKIMRPFQYKAKKGSVWGCCVRNEKWEVGDVIAVWWTQTYDIWLFWKRWIFAGIKRQWLGLQNYFVSTVRYLILLFMLCQCRNCRGIVCYFTATLHRVLSWPRYHRSVLNAWALLKLDRRINDLDLWLSIYLCCYWKMLCHLPLKLVMGHLSSVFSFVVYSMHHIRSYIILYLLQRRSSFSMLFFCTMRM